MFYLFFRACQVAKQAFDEALTEINSAGEGVYKDSTIMMQLLKDNLALWTSELTGGKSIFGKENTFWPLSNGHVDLSDQGVAKLFDEGAKT